MEYLTKEFRSLKTPQRGNLLSDFIHVHTKILKSTENSINHAQNLENKSQSVISPQEVTKKLNLNDLK